jgi:hypothetical protein
MCRERGKTYNYQKGGGGINIVFGPKYRPLQSTQHFSTTNYVYVCYTDPDLPLKIFPIFVLCSPEIFKFWVLSRIQQMTTISVCISVEGAQSHSAYWAKAHSSA